MTELLFSKGQVVMINKGSLQGKQGTVIELRPHTGFEGHNLDSEGKQSQWSIPHEYLVDLGPPDGALPVPEGMRELPSNEDTTQRSKR